MGPPLHNDSPVQVGGGVLVLGFWGRLKGCNVVMSLLRPQQAWILHPYGIYTQYFGTLICCVWAYGATLTLIHPLQVRGGFWGFGGSELWYDVAMSLLRPQQASNCIPHPYCIYTQHFGTLICCVWAYGTTLTGMHLSAGRGWSFGI